MRVIDADLDKTAAEFYSSIDEAKRESPSLASRIKRLKTCSIRLYLSPTQSGQRP